MMLNRCGKGPAIEVTSAVEQYGDKLGGVKVDPTFMFVRYQHRETLLIYCGIK